MVLAYEHISWSMQRWLSGNFADLLFWLVAGVFLLLLIALRGGRRKWRKKPWPNKKWPSEKGTWKPNPPQVLQPEVVNLADPKEQMEYIARVDFELQPLLNKSEYRILVLLELIARELNAGLRVMAQTSMGEILRPKPGSASDFDRDLAYRSVNSKRLDFVVIDRFGQALLAVEYQGHGHYHERSFMRDAVKREALRKAKVDLLEIAAEYDTDDLAEALRQRLRKQLGGCSTSPK
jgi:hypothetical protein